MTVLAWLIVALAPQEKVGYRIVDWKVGDRTLTVAIWYPTDAEPKEHAYGGGPNLGRVAVDAEPKEGACPLFVFSHGYGGSGIGATYFTEALAARGWIVAAPDHEDRDKAARIRTGAQAIDVRAYLDRAKALAASGREFDRKAHAYRLDDVQAAIDQSLQEFGKFIDKKRIAVGGHSLGGFTSLALCGAVRRDERIRAVLLFSPGVFMFDEKEFAAVRVPSMYWLGEREKEERRADTTKSGLADQAFEAMAAPKYFLELKGGTHFSFNTRSSDRPLAKLWSGTDEQFAVIRDYSIAFLERYVAACEEDVLDRDDPRLSRVLRKLK